MDLVCYLVKRPATTYKTLVKPINWVSSSLKIVWARENATIVNMLKTIFHDCSHTADVEILLRGYGSLYWLGVHVNTVVNKTLHT